VLYWLKKKQADGRQVFQHNNNVLGIIKDQIIGYGI